MQAGKRKPGRSLEMARRRLATGALVVATVWVASSGARELVSPSEVDATVETVDVIASPTVVYGEIRNRRSTELRDVELLIVHDFRWEREQQPGDDNPGRTEIVRLDRVPPSGTATFSHDISPPLPTRRDGSFQTRVEVLGFTEIGEPPAPAAGLGAR